MKKTTKKEPRILFWDIESSPILAWIWRPGHKISVSHEQIQKDQKYKIICIAYKWAHEKQVKLINFDIKKQDCTQLLEEFTKILESADVAIAHNGNSFDVKQFNAQRLINNQPPLNWPQTDDTLRQFRKHFAFPSFKLDYLAKTLVGAGKDPMSFQDWLNVVEKKDPKALQKMGKYCKKDVLRLEQVFNKAKAWFVPKVNASIITNGDTTGCPRCASHQLQKNGFLTTMAGRYQRYHCQSCGHKFKSNIKEKLAK